MYMYTNASRDINGRAAATVYVDAHSRAMLGNGGEGRGGVFPDTSWSFYCGNSEVVQTALCEQCWYTYRSFAPALLGNGATTWL